MLTGTVPDIATVDPVTENDELLTVTGGIEMTVTSGRLVMAALIVLLTLTDGVDANTTAGVPDTLMGTVPDMETVDPVTLNDELMTVTLGEFETVTDGVFVMETGAVPRTMTEGVFVTANPVFDIATVDPVTLIDELSRVKLEDPVMDTGTVPLMATVDPVTLKEELLTVTRPIVLVPAGRADPTVTVGVLVMFAETVPLTATVDPETLKDELITVTFGLFVTANPVFEIATVDPVTLNEEFVIVTFEMVIVDDPVVYMGLETVPISVPEAFLKLTWMPRRFVMRAPAVTPLPTAGRLSL